MIQASPLEFYIDRVKELTGSIQTYKQRYNRIATARLVIALLTAITVYTLWDGPLTYIILILVVSLSIFLKLVAMSVKLKQQLNNLQTLLSINNQEIEVLNGRYTHLPEGNNFQQPHHPYSQDLDILGKASLFQYINRTTSEQGQQLLAKWLLQPAKETTIVDRQTAAKELKELPLWRQQLQAYGATNALTFSIQHSVTNWLGQPLRFKTKAAWTYARFILPAVSISFLVLYIFDVIQPGPFYLMLLIFFALSGYISKLVTPQYLQLSKHITQLETLSQSLQWIESATFIGQLLNDLKARLDSIQADDLSQNQTSSETGSAPIAKYSAAVKTGHPQNNRSASAQVKALKNILDRMDYRLNPLVFIPLNIFLFWDLQQVLQLEQWKEQHQDKLQQWFGAIAEAEALSSIANLSFNHPAWTFPTIRPDWFKLECKEAGHPLIPPAKNITNDFGLQSHPQLAFVTGSNMAGKSTFLRTIGTNLVLAMAGAPVCASQFETPVLKVMTSMRIADNLEENASTFYAELQKLKNILEAVKRVNVHAENNQPNKNQSGSKLNEPITNSMDVDALDSEHSPRVFLLLDEILRGTNSLDRHTGSEALIKQLIKEDAVGIIASHDLSLAQLEENFPSIIHNYHFDVTIEGNELSFDYKLKSGVCKTLNATLLMKKIGIDL